MYKAIIFKEWLKIKWTFFILAGLFFLIHLQSALFITYNIRLNNAELVWYSIIFRVELFYIGFLYMPILAGAIIAAVQFFPEISDERLKLTMHLPLKDQNILMATTSVGLAAVLLLFIFMLLGWSIISLYYFPFEMLVSSFKTIQPWLLAGLSVYWLTAMILVEPKWSKRVVYIIFGYTYIQSLLMLNWYNQYSQSILIFLFLTLWFSTSILVTGHRFRRGVR